MRSYKENLIKEFKAIDWKKEITKCSIAVAIGMLLGYVLRLIY